MGRLLRRLGIHVLTGRDLEQRPGLAYRDGYTDGRDGTPYLRGYWLGLISRRVPGAP